MGTWTSILGLGSVIWGLDEHLGAWISNLGHGTDRRELWLHCWRSPHMIFSAPLLGKSPHGILPLGAGGSVIRAPPKQTHRLVPALALLRSITPRRIRVKIPQNQVKIMSNPRKNLVGSESKIQHFCVFCSFLTAHTCTCGVRVGGGPPPPLTQQTMSTQHGITLRCQTPTFVLAEEAEAVTDTV